MLAGHSHKLLAEAAKESIARIQLDRRKAPQRLKPLLAYIEEHLFDPTLDVNQLKRSCGVRDNSVPIQFHSAVGRPPHGYIEDRRLETACRLLAESHLKIWQISELLGYSSIQVFSRAFSRWSGQRPTLFRKKAQRGGTAETGRERAARMSGDKRFDRSLVAADSLRKALDGELPTEEAETVIERLLKLYPGARDALGVDESILTDDSNQGSDVDAPELDNESLPDAESAQLVGNARDRFVAETIWKQLDGETAERQETILEQTTVTSAALFHLLLDKSREVGRSHHERGVKVAELALASLDSLVRRSGDEQQFAGLKARGWCRLASARNLASDQRAAERGLDEAERQLEAAGNPPAVAVELLTCNASLRRDQRRFREARELLERADELCPENEADLKAKILLLQASVRFEEGNPTASVPFLEQALPLARDSEDYVLKLAVYHNLVASYAEAGAYDKAVKLLPAAKKLSQEHGTGFNKIRFYWLEGLVARGLGELEKAEKTLAATLAAFSEMGDGFNTALVSLDLADLYARQSRTQELADLCRSMAPLAGVRLQNHREALTALQMFQRAAEEKSVTSMVVDKARKALRQGQKQAG